MDKITKWAKAIEVWEGNAQWLNNPGSLKFSSLTNSWGATPGVQAGDGGYIAKFKDYRSGFAALCNFLVLGCEDHLAYFHDARTLGSFTRKYAGNPPQDYIDGIAHILGVPLDTDIATFLAKDMPAVTPPQAPAMPQDDQKPAEPPSLPSALITLTAWQRFCAFLTSLFHV